MWWRHTYLENANVCIRTTLWRLAAFGDFRKKTPKRTWLCAGISPVRLLYRIGQSLKRRGKSSSLHSKKFFAWGMRFFCEWRHKRSTFRPPWPTLPSPGHQPLGGSSCFYWKLGYSPSLLILWMIYWGFGFKSCDVS